MYANATLGLRANLFDAALAQYFFIHHGQREWIILFLSETAFYVLEDC